MGLLCFPHRSKAFFFCFNWIRAKFEGKICKLWAKVATEHCGHTIFFFLYRFFRHISHKVCPHAVKIRGTRVSSSNSPLQSGQFIIKSMHMQERNYENIKAHEQWQGDNVFFCNGSLMLG